MSPSAARPSAHTNAAIPLCVAFFAITACQDYPFAFRRNSRIDAQKLNQLVATLTPVDILFMIDDSSTMVEERAALENNVERFVTELVAQNLDFQIGIITTDVECNMPNRTCIGTDAFSDACCGLLSGVPVCTDQDNNGDGTYETSNCEAGRLQGNGASGTRVFKPPAAGDEQQWIADFTATIDFSAHDLKGSSYESGIQAATLAVACAVGSDDCTDVATGLPGSAKAVKDLNAGFIRDAADLVIIFMSDEDDCSAGDTSIYRRPNNPSLATDQGNHFCSPDECYAYYSTQDSDGDGLDDWSDPTDGLPSTTRLRCGDTGTIDRLVNPPGLHDLGSFLDKLTTYKGDIHKVRAAGIVSAVQLNPDAGYTGDACYDTPNGPSAACGCTADANDFSCQVTAANGQGSDREPTRSDTPGGPIDHFASGCTSAPGNRYVQFLADLSDRHISAGFASDILVDSICRTAYDATMDAIVNNVIIPKCFTLGAAPSSPDFLTVTLNGAALPNVPVGSTQKGWSLVPGSQEICLEGGLTKAVGDRFEILQVTATQ